MEVINDLRTMDGDSDTALSDEELVTAEKVLAALEEAWLNEKFSPELLQHRTDLVDCMMEQISQMEENLNRLNKTDFRVVVHRMELDRIRYVITSYLRIRLEKIELFTAHILEEDSKRNSDDSYLSPAEFRFATDFLASVESHFRQLALRHMPTNMQNCDKAKMSVKPNISSFVFLRSKQNVSGVVVEGDVENRDEEIDLEEGSQHIMQYKTVQELVKSGQIQLI
ncbi:DNA replication complex GINS protein SLD5 [Bacillus rossius redtenbacheri]|uniref:DNA replication complex GINS protein SLD5 n=1 Tax=Bacillus rossius redtenbacheri TaxID=93214 RepID=UPI002FDD0316